MLYMSEIQRSSVSEYASREIDPQRSRYISFGMGGDMQQNARGTPRVRKWPCTDRSKALVRRQ